MLTCAQAQAAQGGPDIHGYTWIDSTEDGGPTYSFEFGSNELPGLDDDDVETVDIGFTFTYLGQGYTQVDVHSNGALSFGASGPIGHSHDCAALVPNNQGTSDPLDVPVLLPYWTDLDPTGNDAGAVYTRTTGVAPNRVLIVEWFQIPPYNDPDPATFEAKLFEADGAIEFHYLDLDVSGDGRDNGAASAIGISADSGHYFAVSCDSASIVGPGIAVRFEPPCDDEDGDGVTVCDDDCDDDNPDVYPGAVELCNGEDENCDGLVPPDETDEDGDSWMGCQDDCNDSDPTLTPEDADGDGQSSCDGDCDDNDDLTWLGAPEQCDGLDNDCDGEPETEEEVEFVDWYPDLDGDGFGDESDSLFDCQQPDGRVSVGGDCDDGDDGVHPDVEESCDGRDQDCDPATDLGGTDHDGDGDGVLACAGDCNDSDPAAAELCSDDVDQDCDGTEAETGEDPECWESGCSSCRSSVLGPGSLALPVVGLWFLGLRRRRGRVGRETGSRITPRRGR